MIRGMTGHASCSFSTDIFDAEMEIKSVNSRYFEFRMKVPARYSILEIEARKLVSSRLARGKIDLNLRINEKEINSNHVLINKHLAKAYLEESVKIAQELGLSDTLSLRELLSLPQVLNTDISDIDESILKMILDNLNTLIDKMIVMMAAEGASTIKDIKNSLEIMENSLASIKRRYPVVLEKYKNSLKERVLEISSAKVPEERLIIEIELFASRTAINEEVVRLSSHIALMKDVLDENTVKTSKEFDFIAQEMNREANTIASKSLDLQITEDTIILKSEIEKMREQFRNIV